MPHYFKIISVFFFSAFFSNLNATVTLPNFFSNNMVLQRGEKISIWGNASKGERVTVRLGVNRAETITGSDGKWMVKLKPMKAGGPYTLTIAGDNSVEFSNGPINQVPYAKIFPTSA